MWLGVYEDWLIDIQIRAKDYFGSSLQEGVLKRLAPAWRLNQRLSPAMGGLKAPVAHHYDDESRPAAEKLSSFLIAFQSIDLHQLRTIEFEILAART
jgi:hypothetical protein